MESAAPSTFPRFASPEGRQRYLTAYEAALKAWPVPCEAIDVPTRLGPTHVIVSGAPGAPPLILLPSFAGTALAWRPNVEALSRNWRVYALDVIGQPGLSGPVRRIGHAREYGPWLVDLLDRLGVERASLVGCSFGGFLAASLALLAPQRVDRVVLIGPVGVFAAMSWTTVLRMRTARLRRGLRRALGNRRAPSVALHAAAAPMHPEDDGWRRLMGVTMAEAPRVSVTNTRVFSRRTLARISAPMLLLIGEHEQAYDARVVARRARNRMPDLEVEVVEGADHIAAMAQPERVNARIVDFLRGGGEPR